MLDKFVSKDPGTVTLIFQAIAEGIRNDMHPVQTADYLRQLGAQLAQAGQPMVISVDLILAGAPYCPFKALKLVVDMLTKLDADDRALLVSPKAEAWWRMLQQAIINPSLAKKVRADIAAREAGPV